MPEFYAEPMKDRKSCSVCKKTVTGKKVLLTCINCHAITYCGRECQKADWDRHEWNCVPVMVTEIQGKGRGLVAARDIETGEVIFKDKAVIKLAINAEGQFVDPDFLTSLKQQIDSLPTEAKSQYYKLTTRDDIAKFNASSDKEILKLFLSNSQIRRHNYLLHLNIALINHSCAPNATNGVFLKRSKQVGDDDLSVELRAIKNISKGEEITVCYFFDVKKFGSIPRKRKTAFKKDQGFNCKCPICLGQVQDQEKTLKKLIELHNKLNPTSSDWKREAGLRSRIADLTMELYIGTPRDKIMALDDLVRFAHLARNKDLVKKAMNMAKQFAEETKLEDIQGGYETWERGLAKWSKEFRSNNAPEKKEIDFFLNQKTMMVF